MAARALLEAETLLAAALGGDWPPAVVREWSLERARATLVALDAAVTTNSGFDE